MAKKLISVWLSLTILLFSSISIYAGDNVQGSFFFRDITINGQKINNYHMENPVFVFADSTYIPLDAEMVELLDIKAELETESRTLKIWKLDSSKTNVSQPWMKNDGEDVMTQVLDDVKVVLYDKAEKTTAVQENTAKQEQAAVKGEDGSDPDTSESEQVVKEPVIQAPQLQATQVDLKGMPVLIRGNVLYIPVAALTGSEAFGWDIYYDSYSGIYISTNEGVTAKSLFDEPVSRYNRGLVAYMQKYNGSYTTDKAQEMVFTFKHAAEMYNMDVTFLMSVSRKESTFNASAKSSAGATGMMQIMPATAARYGISATQLYDPHVNIDFGAKYLSERLAAYNGNAVVALSAYNQGSGTVSRGGYSTRYASNVLDAKADLDYYLKANGYGTGQ